MSLCQDVSCLSRDARLQIVRALVRAVEAKDPYTRRHSEQVAYYTMHLARALGASAEQIEVFRAAALLHDVGKIGVPDYILTKPDRLTPEEFEFVRRHPTIGAEIVSTLAMLDQEASLVRHHHERWDGRGYPDGLTGEESPLGARIILVADCMDAMLMDRSYKRGLSVSQMVDELGRCTGTQFDPRVASRAIQWCRTNPQLLILPGEPPASHPALRTPELHGSTT